MAGELGESFVLVTPRLNRAEAAKVGQQVGQSITSAQSGLLAKAKGVGGTIMQGIGLGLGAGLVTNVGPAIVGFGKQLFDLGGEMELLRAKSATVFGENLATVQRWAAGAAGPMGLTKDRTTALAASIGDLLVPMGFARDKAAEMSMTTLDLAGALSEWTGGTKSAAEASQILAKAYLGERDGLVELGIKVSDAEVDQAALNIAKATGRDATDAQVRAEATLEQVLLKSKDAQTAYAEGTDSNLRKQRELSARIGELKERVAAGLVPAYGAALGFVLDLGTAAGQLAGFLGEHPALIHAITGALALFAASKAIGAVGQLSGALDTLRLRAMYAQGGLAAAAKGINPYAVAIGVAVFAVTSFIQKKREQEARVKAVRDAILAESDALDENATATLRKAVADKGLADDLRTIGMSMEELEAALNGDTEAMTKLTAAGEEHGDEVLRIAMATNDYRKGLKDAAQQALDTAVTEGALTEAQADRIAEQNRMSEEMGNYRGVLEAVSNANGEHVTTEEAAAQAELDHAGAAASGADAQATLEESLKATTEAGDKLADAADLARQAIDRLTGAAMESDAAAMAYEEQLDGLTDSLKENGRTFDISTEKGRTNRQAAIDLATSIRDLQLAHIRETGDVKAATAAGDLYNEQLARQLRAAGMTEGEIMTLIATYGQVPRDVATKLSADTATATYKIGAARGLATKYERTYTSRLDADLTPLEAKIRAMKIAIANAKLLGKGGLARGGDPAIVGEEAGNDELVLPFGHPARLRALLAQHGARIAAVAGMGAGDLLGGGAGGQLAMAGGGGGGGGSPISVGQVVVQLPSSANITTPAGARAAAILLRRALIDLEAEDG